MNQCSMNWGVRNTYKILVRKCIRNKPLVKPRHRRENNIEVDLQEVGCEYVDRIYLLQDILQWWAFVYTVMNLRVG
jgi:hypothetical protein